MRCTPQLRSLYAASCLRVRGMASAVVRAASGLAATLGCHSLLSLPCRVAHGHEEWHRRNPHPSPPLRHALRGRGMARAGQAGQDRARESRLEMLLSARTSLACIGSGPRSFVAVLLVTFDNHLESLSRWRTLRLRDLNWLSTAGFDALGLVGRIARCCCCCGSVCSRGGYYGEGGGTQVSGTLCLFSSLAVRQIVCLLTLSFESCKIVCVGLLPLPR